MVKEKHTKKVQKVQKVQKEHDVKYVNDTVLVDYETINKHIKVEEIEEVQTNSYVDDVIFWF